MQMRSPPRPSVSACRTAGPTRLDSAVNARSTDKNFAIYGFAKRAPLCVHEEGRRQIAIRFVFVFCGEIYAGKLFGASSGSRLAAGEKTDKERLYRPQSISPRLIIADYVLEVINGCRHESAIRFPFDRYLVDRSSAHSPLS
jgi:hypothetical protein